MKNSQKKNRAKKIIALFKNGSIRAMSMKLYSNDADIDIVIIDPLNYQKAQSILTENGWTLQNNRSKLRERDKDFYVRVNYPYNIHLHAYFSWNTTVYLNSVTLFKRAAKIKNSSTPTPEDELLIIAAHSLFENQHITPEEVAYAQSLICRPLDYTYMRSHARSYGWDIGFDQVYAALMQKRSFLSIKELVRAKRQKLFHDIRKRDFVGVVRDCINFFFIDWAWNYRLMTRKYERVSQNNQH